MIAGAGFVLWQKRVGVLAMVLLVGALLALVDALVGGFMGGQRLIELIPGTRYAISGPMPPKTTALKDFIIEGQQPTASTQLVPEAIYSGYLFGGAMWRGAIVVDPAAREGNYEFKVKDSFGEKQNPTLVFKVKVWPDQATLNAHSKSLLIRLTGRKPFMVAFGFALSGLLAAGINFILGRLWARHLATHQCGEIYRVRNTKQGKEVTCEIHCDFAVHPDMPCKIYRPSGELLCTAHISGCDNNEVLMLVDEPELVRMGDVACILSPPAESEEKPDQGTQAG